MANKTMHHVVIGSDTYEIVDQYAREYGGGGGGGGGSGPSPYTSNPAALGSASPGTVSKYARGDHVHPMPSAGDTGAIAAPSSPAAGTFLTWNGTAWVASAPTATTTAAGLMSAQDKGRLDDLYADYSAALTALG